MLSGSALAFVASCFLWLTASAVHVKGYTKKDGTYVAPHERTAPNHTKNDNYSTKGNVNPYTGKEGTKPRDVETLTSSPATTQQPTPKTVSAVVERSPVTGWLAIRSGLHDSEVMRQLGSPRLVDNKGTHEVWSYPTGTVFVKDRKVVAWKQLPSK